MMTPVLVGNAIGTRECIPYNLKYSSSDMLHEYDWPGWWMASVKAS